MNRSLKFRNITAVTILALGCTQMAGYLLDSRPLRGIGLATGFAPFPKVFCESNGYEPFAATFTLLGENPDGETISIPINAERYNLLDGPYLRRNVHGAALAYSPRLPEDLRQHLFERILTPDSPLSTELDLPELINPRIHIQTREGEAVSSYEYPLNS